MAVNGALVNIRRETLSLQLIKTMETEESKGENVKGLESRMNMELSEIKKNVSEMKACMIKCMEMV